MPVYVLWLFWMVMPVYVLWLFKFMSVSVLAFSSWKRWKYSVFHTWPVCCILGWSEFTGILLLMRLTPPLWTSTCPVDMKYTSLSWNSLYNDLLDLKLKFSYNMIDEILVQNTPTSVHEKKTGWCQWALICSVDVHMELTPPPSACIHLRLTPSMWTS